MRKKLIKCALVTVIMQVILLIAGIIGIEFNFVWILICYGLFTIVAGIVTLTAYLLIVEPRSQGSLVNIIGFGISNVMLLISKSELSIILLLIVLILFNGVSIYLLSKELRASVE